MSNVLPWSPPTRVGCGRVIRESLRIQLHIVSSHTNSDPLGMSCTALISPLKASRLRFVLHRTRSNGSVPTKSEDKRLDNESALECTLSAAMSTPCGTESCVAEDTPLCKSTLQDMPRATARDLPEGECPMLVKHASLPHPSGETKP